MTASTTRRRLSALAATGAAALAAAALTVGAPAANAKTIHLPTQTKTQRIADGTNVTINRTADHVTIVGSMASTPLHRSVIVSGRYSVNLSKPASTILLQAGYIVGCQVSVSGISTTESGTNTNTLSTGANAQSGTAGGTLTIGPGQAATYYITDWERTDPFGGDQHKYYAPFTNTAHAKLNYVNTTIGVNGCGGYAQARSFANVWVINGSGDQIVSLYGKPFSVG